LLEIECFVHRTQNKAIMPFMLGTRSDPAAVTQAIDSRGKVHLASIVAIDVAGYSRLAEQDQVRAARVVMEVRAQVEAAAKRHAGRVFNTAGDGLMLEFPAAERAIAAIIDLIDRPLAEGPPIRIGAHLGDVFMTEGGDLLGHGVNVSARLQALTRPGTALVSGDLHSAVQGDHLSRLRRLGRVSLPKMDQRLAVYEVVPLGRHVRLGPPRHVIRTIGAAAALTCVAGIVVALLLWKPFAFLGGSSGSAGDKPLVAVLPFDNLSAEPNSEYLADGVSEEILDALTHGGAVRVSARTSSFAFRGSRKPEAASVLGADYVLDGSIRRDGAHIRVSAYLNDPRKGIAVWSRTFDRDLSQTLALEDEIAGEVARALKLVLVSPSSSPNAPAIDPATYELYLRGMQALEQVSDDGNIRALGLLKTVVERQPNFARGWSALARALGRVAPAPGTSPDWEKASDEATAAAERAVALDPNDGQAYTGLAGRSTWEDWDRTDTLIKKGLAVSPNDPVVLSQWGGFLAETGYEREAVEVLRRALEQDPLNPWSIWALTNALAATGDRTGAEAVLDDGMKRMPMNFILCRLKFHFLLQDKKFDEVEKRLAPGAIQPDGENENYLRSDRLFYKAFMSRNATDIEASLRVYYEQTAKDIYNTENLVTKLVLLGRTDEAFAVAEQYFPAGAVIQSKNGPIPKAPGYNLLFYLALPSLADFRHDPRFMRLLDQDGLVEYWRTSGKWPDFCAEPNLGYDCKAEAEKLVAARKRRSHA
jgi:TolB-like protein/class 3 adenylate cyclase/Tfp pilus assembly protein PilF